MGEGLNKTSSDQKANKLQPVALGTFEILHNGKHSLFACIYRELKALKLQGIKQMVGDCFARIPENLPYLQSLDLSHCNRVGGKLLV